MVSKEYLQNVLNLKCDFLFYIKLRRRIQTVIGNNLIQPYNNPHPHLPYILHIMDIGNKGNKNTYFSTINTGNMVLTHIQQKWSESLNDEVQLEVLIKAFKSAKQYSPSMYQHFNQFKLVHDKMLFKIGISDTPNCLYCNNLETIEHMYIECDNVVQLWRNTEIWVRQLYNPQFKISDIEKCFGEKCNKYVKHVIIISVKDVIYQKRKSGNQMLLPDVKKSLLRNLHILRSLEIITRNNTEVFDNNWEIFIDFFRTDFCSRNSWYTI